MQQKIKQNAILLGDVITCHINYKQFVSNLHDKQSKDI